MSRADCSATPPLPGDGDVAGAGLWDAADLHDYGVEDNPTRPADGELMPRIVHEFNGWMAPLPCCNRWPDAVGMGDGLSRDTAKVTCHR